MRFKHIATRLVRPLIFFVVGIVMSVLIAWICVLWSPVVYERKTTTGTNVPAEMLSVIDQPSQYKTIYVWRRSYMPGYDLDVLFSEKEQHTEHVVLTPHMALYRAGWPLRCLDGELRIGRGGRSSREHGLWPRDIEVVVGESYGLRRLPLRPHWIGLPINGAIYGSAVFGLWYVAANFRRWRRRLRGECTRCGYDLRGTLEASRAACPECGEPFRLRDETAARR